ncbi:hypothetical protein B0T17DRAFT_486235 [Bombardia bombarda]|uniref:Uncharacterized protein n=1 Tax=Bombardia bombarda TaxID=252184 RepID=A0AA40C7X2_9PEZI|nr:hypothetical protein B0T17DRAFT_486235 [Bombardia bombarda]
MADTTIATPSPGHSREVHTPPAPHLGYGDSWEPYSPRKSARISQRGASTRRTPSPSLQSSRQSDPHHVLLGSPKQKKKTLNNGTSSIATPFMSPHKKRAAAAAPSVGGMLITPAKTPQKPPTEKTAAKIQHIARNLFHNDTEVMPTPKRTRTQEYTLDSFSMDDEVDEPIEIYTDSHERIPEVDHSVDNPFYIPPEPPRRSKRQTVTSRSEGKAKEETVNIPGVGKVTVDEAIRRDDGMLTVFRGKKQFRKFAVAEGVAAAEREVVDTVDNGLEGAVESRLRRPLTRSAVKPRLLFPVPKPEPVEDNSHLEDEEAETDIEDHVMTTMEEAEDEHTTPTELVEEAPGTPKAPKFTPASPPTTARTTRHSSKKATDATPVKPKTGTKASLFDGWRRVKGGSSDGQGQKRSGDAMSAGPPAKRPRND